MPLKEIMCSQYKKSFDGLPYEEGRDGQNRGYVGRVMNLEVLRIFSFWCESVLLWQPLFSAWCQVLGVTEVDKAYPKSR